MVAAQTIIVTKHAERRCRQRLGLKRKAVARTVQNAWSNGLTLDGVEDEGRILKVWGGTIFVFSHDVAVVRCVTVYPPGAALRAERSNLAHIVEGQLGSR